MEGGGARSYEEVLSEYGSFYDPTAGTDTKGGLEKLYGEGNVRVGSKGSPAVIGREMKMGNPTILAKDRNHALVLTKIEIWSKQFTNRAPKTYFNIRYMDPARQKFIYEFNYKWSDPAFTVKFKR